MAYGTLSVTDLLATTVTVVKFGEDRLWDNFQALLTAHNSFMKDITSSLVEVTLDRSRRYGGTDKITMTRLGEYGTPDVQKATTNARVEFPMYETGTALQWTRKYLQNKTVADLTGTLLATQDADVVAVTADIKNALFGPTNRTVSDKLVDNLPLNVKAMVNADGAPIPIAPDGSSFNASTHTHYLKTAGTTLTSADLDALIATVLEHWNVGTLRVYINQAQQSTVAGFTGYVAGIPVGYNAPTTVGTIDVPLDILNTKNRMIGSYGPNWAQVWVKPWIPAGYVFAYMEGAPKPLVLRTRDGSYTGLQIIHEDENVPLRAQALSHEYGVGAWNRTNGAMLYIDTGAIGSYQSPVFTY